MMNTNMHVRKSPEDIQAEIPLILHKFPGLGNRIRWMPLGSFPTRIHRLSHLGLKNVWIKREDESSSLYGGNKVRKLEFTLADAVGKKIKKVVTMGGIGTNHGLATAIFCHHLGLACRLLLFDQPVTTYVKRNMLLFYKYGAELVWYKSILRTGAMFYTGERLMNPGAYFLYAGGSSPLGTIGVVNAAFELKKQIDDGVMPEPRYIFCPLGSNGTMAGLQLGLCLAGINSEVIGVRVSVDSIGPLDIATPGAVTSLIKQTHQMLRKNSPHVPDVRITAPHILDDYFGTGYGCPTRECLEALNILHEKENIRLDPTYTAKTFAAVLDFARNSARPGDVILYWHTYNSVDLSAQAKTVDYHDLPKKFHRVFEEQDVAV